MNLKNGRHGELLELLELLCEERLSPSEIERLESLVLEDRDARTLYLSYINLHGTLYWDEASGGTALPEPTEEPVVAPMRRTGWWSRSRVAAVAAVAAVVLVAVVVSESWSPDGPGEAVVGPPEPGPGPVNVNPEPPERRNTLRVGPSVPLANKRTPAPEAPEGVIPDQPEKPRGSSGAGSLSAVVASIDNRIEQGWRDNEITPSPVASDSEWLRRIYPDIVGHIPSAETAQEFLSDRRKGKEKYSELIEQLLDDQDYVRNFSTIWANLLIGRSESRDVNRPGLEKFLREAFARNRPWNEVVFELVSAEGRGDQVGAANFLLAHLNNEAVPATAITARLFLGTQVQCTQCHDHPFNKWQQGQFWQFNSFFAGTGTAVRYGQDPSTGRRVRLFVELVSQPVDGMTFYEDRRGIKHATQPRYPDREVVIGPEIKRREVLASLMTDGRDPRLASAMVNRVWRHFFGHGFTNPVDDMGPHNAPSHPELLDRLAGEFMRSGFDLKQLVRWVCHSRAYRLSSRFGETNQDDDPGSGSAALFSRVYVKAMTAEQLYDSLVVATRADRAVGSDWAAVAEQRQHWVQQFVIAFETEENDEVTTFDGSIPQALMMMNGKLVQQALEPRPGTYLRTVIHNREYDINKIKRLCLAALSRYPTSRELQAVKGMLPLRSPAESRRSDPEPELVSGLQDVFWAYLNSNEFILVP